MDAIRILHLITEPTRFKILSLLFEHRYCVQALAKKVGISESAVSQHLSILKKHGIVTGEKRGYQLHHSINKGLVLQALCELSAQFESYDCGGRDLSKCACAFRSACIRRKPKQWSETHGQ